MRGRKLRLGRTLTAAAAALRWRCRRHKVFSWMISSQDGSAVSDRVRGGFLLLSGVSMGVGWWVYGGRCFMHSVPSYSCMFVWVKTALRGVRNTLRRVFSDALMGMCCSLPKHQHPVQTMEGLQSPPPSSSSVSHTNSQPSCVLSLTLKPVVGCVITSSHAVFIVEWVCGKL